MSQVPRRLGPLAICLLLALAAGESGAVEIPSTSVRLTWAAAAGPVSGYVVYVSRNGSSYTEERRISERSVRVYGAVGETLRVQVAAHDADGTVGPRSAASDPIVFVASQTPGQGGDPTTDIDGDGRSDMLVHDGKTKELSALLLQEDGSRVSQLVGEQTGKLAAVGWADADGDGEADVLWRDAKSGHNELWMLDGTVFTRRSLPDQPTGWSVAAFRDLDRDGIADVLWHDATSRQSEVWWLDGTGVASVQSVEAGPANGVLVAVADFDGDGFPDLVWRDAQTGAVEGWQMRDAEPIGIVVLPSVAAKDSVAGVGDLDGDGKEDLVWLSARGKKKYVLVAWFMRGVEHPEVGVALALDGQSLAAVLDADSDGQAEILTKGSSKSKSKSKSKGGRSFSVWSVLPNGTPDANGELWWEIQPGTEISLGKSASLVDED